ncbi:MAG: septum formation initiator family protein [Desulfobacterales bacterium]|nr:septum formation initiator family protein [Desulfobacterales bacterium]
MNKPSSPDSNKGAQANPGAAPTGYEQLKRRLRLLFLVFTIIGLCVYAILGENGLLDVYKIKGEKEGIVRENATLEAENKRLAREVELLKTDKRYIAKVARKELGMIGEDEILYKIKDDDQPKP